MTREEYIEFANALKNNYTIDFDKLPEFCDMAISALEGLDLPNNATNEDALNYMLRQTFPKVIFIHFHNEVNFTSGIIMAEEWLSKPYKKGDKE